MTVRRRSQMRKLALCLSLVIGFATIGEVGTVLPIGSVGMSGWPAPALSASANDVAEPPFNPHGNLVFRATGAASCRDCHVTPRSASRAWPVRDNERVRSLVARGKGAHVGRFADCFRCHAGGRLPSEQP